MTSKASDERVILSNDVIPVNYDVFISTNVAGDFKYKGNVAITLDLKKDTSEIQLHAKDLELLSITATVSGGSSMKGKVSGYDKKDEVVTLSFESPLLKGNLKLLIDFIGVHNDEMNGFYRSTKTGKDGKERIMVSTQFEPLDARRCFPCVDEPDKKATFICSLEIDDGLCALSNMPVTSTTPASEKGRSIVKFDVTPKMSTYLLAFCVGEFDFIETTTKFDVKLRVYTPVGKKHLGDFALHVGSKALDLYDAMFGQPFPLPKMDMIGLPQFAAGAMENWGLITYREVDLLIDSDNASSQQMQRVASVVAHELAHQWFGNLVTMKWWNDLWLNEGFATWMQDYVTNEIYPEWKLWDQFIVDAQASALSLDSLLSSHPIQVPIRRAQEVEEVFDHISYYKGGCVVRMINAFLGQEFFLEGLKLYMKRHAYGNTETTDLWNAWEEVSKKPVNKVMASWTLQQGFPLVTVTDCKVDDKTGEATLSLTQEWFLADGSCPEKKTWAIPMFIKTEQEERSLDLFVEEKTQIKLKVGKGPFWVKLNANQNVPLRVNYPVEMWHQLSAAASNGNLSSIDKSGLVSDAVGLIKANKLDPSVIISLLKGLKKEESYTVWRAISSAVTELNEVLGEKPELKAKFAALVKGLVLPVFEKLGWDPKATDGHLDKMLRALLVGLLEKFASDEESIYTAAKVKYEAYLKDQKTKQLPAEYKTTVFRIVLSNSSTNKEFDELLSLLPKLETTVEKKDVYLALGFIKDMKLKEKVLELAISGEIKKQDFFYLIASVSASGVEGRELSWSFFKDNYSKIWDMLKTASTSLMNAAITYSVMGFASKEVAKDMEQFFASHENKSERKVSQLIEGILNRATFKEIVLGSKEFAAALEK